MQNKPFFLVVEGIDGSGKTTFIQKILKKKFQREEVVFTVEPGGSKISRNLRKLIMNEELDQMTVLLLMISARIENINKVINPALRAGKNVISDRFTPSTIAYQQFGFKIDKSIVEFLCQLVPSTLIDPQVILLDIHPQDALKRKKIKNKFDQLSHEFYLRVSEGYKVMACEKDFIVLDALKSVKELSEEVNKILG